VGCMKRLPHPRLMPPNTKHTPQRAKPDRAMQPLKQIPQLAHPLHASDASPASRPTTGIGGAPNAFQAILSRRSN
jgi:hypothetical protein